MDSRTIPATRLAISIVLYKPQQALLKQTLNSLSQAIIYAKEKKTLKAAQIFLIDNSPVPTKDLESLFTQSNILRAIDKREVLYLPENIGYGAGHNQVLDRHNCNVHLILNPDVIIDKTALYYGLRFLQNHPDAGLLAPAVSNSERQIQFLCKRYPSILDLFLRGFAPDFVKSLFQKRLDYYEMHDVIGARTVWDIPIISGCFMLARSTLLTKIQGFNPAYFLYFEDFDLSLRIAQHTRLVYLAEMRIIHFGGHASSKGWRHRHYFIRSAIIFFKQHGWKWW